jgi:MHS family proline/betaine transporter-like MFS transporter
VPEHKRGFFGCLALTGVGTGLILSACTIFIIEALVSEEAIYAYAWRVPFFISVIGSMVAYYMRRNLLETEDFIKIKQTGNFIKYPLIELFKNHKTTLLRLFAIFLTTQISFFIVFIYGKTMMIDFLHFDSYTAGKYNLFTVISYTIATVIFGYLSDKINKKHIILCGVIILGLSANIFINSLKSGNASEILFMSLLLGLLIGMTEGTLNPLVAESFPVNIRATAVAFCWNFTAVAFGGSAPIVSMWLIERTGSVDVVGYYLMSACIVTMISILYTLSYSCYRSQARGA